MKNFRKAVCMFLALVTIGLVVVSCSSSKTDPIIGEWVWKFDDKNILTLLESGKAYLSRGSSNSKYDGDGTWEKVSNGKYVIIIHDTTWGNLKFDVVLNGNTITLTRDDGSTNGYKQEFTRK
ncbi:MAG: hypothetical protein II871_04550 [Clostridia bacterium]|nr:hypothetical protein [Clostridia bacterium]